MGNKNYIYYLSNVIFWGHWGHFAQIRIGLLILGLTQLAIVSLVLGFSRSGRNRSFRAVNICVTQWITLFLTLVGAIFWKIQPELREIVFLLLWIIVFLIVQIWFYFNKPEGQEELKKKKVTRPASVDSIRIGITPSRVIQLANLTPREREIASLLVANQSNAEIASDLVLSIHTVKKHVRQVLKKSGVKNRHKFRDEILRLK